jgi:hypothetical protein
MPRKISPQDEYEQALPHHVVGALATPAAKEGWPLRTITERDFVACGLQRLGEPDRRRAIAVRLRPDDRIAHVIRTLTP